MAFGRSRQAGSSPLTRGKPRPILAPWIGIGLIPAHAGKTGRTADGRASRRAHPRSRGENSPADEDSSAFFGSSPLTRGKLGALGVFAEVDRLIPAHAGKTCGRTGARTHARAHPRSRGENLSGCDEPINQLGSSPLTRGKHNCESSFHYRGRLIPAHAGKTAEGQRPVHERAAHPRSRGENRRRRRPADPPHRLIPAHAGKTPPRCPGRHKRWAHPRSRGENRHGTHADGLSLGSSPLTRGKPAHFAFLSCLTGLIPAHAGKTSVRDV